MDTLLGSTAFAAHATDALVLLHFSAEDRPVSPGFSECNQLTGQWLEELTSSGESKGNLMDLAILHRPQGLAARRLVAAGAGKGSSFTPALLRKLTGAAFRTLKGKSARSISLVLDGEFASPAFVEAAIEGAILADFEVDRHKSDKSDQKEVHSFTILVPKLTPEIQAAWVKGQALANGQNFTRELVNEPANLLTPLVLAERAKAMAESAGLGYELLDEGRMRQMGMGSLLGVAQGSANPPCLIVLRYQPEHPSSADQLALIGKGVTFDTGGVSIKPADGMEKMKYDMAGGAAVIGAMQAIATLRPSVAVTAYIPAVENMCGGKSQRPGDIVTSLSGKTIEVQNTDAEGRLILVDAIEYARRQGATHMIDAATLTGAIVVALGHVHVGAFTNNQEFLNRFLSAAAAQGEKMWQMPLDDDYKDYLKNPFADLSNIGGRWGGAITAAYFLKEWTQGTPWIHLDIAGTAWLEESKPFLAKGPTGVGVRSFVECALQWGKA